MVFIFFKKEEELWLVATGDGVDHIERMAGLEGWMGLSLLFF